MLPGAPKIEPLEHNAELGVYLQTATGQDAEVSRDIYVAQFNPKHRFLATAGSGYIAHLWDLSRDDLTEFKPTEIPHIKDAEQENQNTAVSSIHWNRAGDKLLTSSSDMAARVWKVTQGCDATILKVKNFNEYLMQSKFCDDADNLVATGGLMSQIFVWDCETPDNKEVACFDHSEIDSNFKGLEIEWQNSKCVAVAGKS